MADEVWEEWEEAYKGVERDAGEVLRRDLQDRSMRTQLRINGWKPKQTGDAMRQAIEWYAFDFEYSYPVEQSSLTWSVVVSFGFQISPPTMECQLCGFFHIAVFEMEPSIEQKRIQNENTNTSQNYNTTFYQFSNANNFVHDQRGFSHCKHLHKSLSHIYISQLKTLDPN